MWFMSLSVAVSFCCIPIDRTALTGALWGCRKDFWLRQCGYVFQRLMELSECPGDHYVRKRGGFLTELLQFPLCWFCPMPAGVFAGQGLSRAFPWSRGRKRTWCFLHHQRKLPNSSPPDQFQRYGLRYSCSLLTGWLEYADNISCFSESAWQCQSVRRHAASVLSLSIQRRYVTCRKGYLS